MGYVRKRTFKIRFGDGHEFEGLEVRMRSVSVGKLLQLLPKIDALDGIAVATKPEDVEEIKEVFREFSTLIDSWNIEDEDGTPVPVTCEALMDQELRLVVAVIQQWAEYVSGVPAPLDEPSPSGGPSLEASLPMETLSPSLPS